MALKHIPNIITSLRILLVIPIVGSILNANYKFAGMLFILAGITDGFDGFLARQCHWESRLGSILDPVADKLLLISCLLALVIKQIIPLWLPILLITRDLWILAGAITYHFMIDTYEMEPTLISKANTCLQILFLFLLFIHLGLSPINPWLIKIILWLTVFVCTLSGIHYTYVWGKKAWQVYLKRKSHVD